MWRLLFLSSKIVGLWRYNEDARSANEKAGYHDDIRQLVGLCFLRASSCEAIAAVNRPVSARVERDFGHAAAFAARRREHLAFWTVARSVLAATSRVALRLARFTAIRAAPGILREALLGVEVLLRSRERELSIAVATRQGPINGNHVFSSLVSRGDTRCRFEAFQ